MAAASILVVDDEIQVLSFIMELLRMQGYGVEGTWDPDEALRLARAHPGPLHLLLTDLVMPVMTGSELAREISRIQAAKKVLFMSAYSEEAAQDYEVWLAPGEPFLSKPFSIATLGQTVRAASTTSRPHGSPVERVVLHLSVGDCGRSDDACLLRDARLLRRA